MSLMTSIQQGNNWTKVLFTLRFTLIVKLKDEKPGNTNHYQAQSEAGGKPP